LQFDSTKHIALARIGKPVGLVGLCRVFPFGDTLVNAELPFELWVGTPKSIESITLTDLNSSGDVIKAKFKGFTDCDAVDRIKNFFLYTDIEKLPPVDEDEFYFRDLEGLTVETETGDSWGVVTEVFSFPTTDAIEVKRKNGQRVLVPFRKETISAVLLAEKKIIVASEILEDLL